MTKNIRIISLGEIITIDIKKTIDAFVALIASKKDNAKTLLAKIEITKQIGSVIASTANLIEEFKLGKVLEEKFIEQLIDAIQKATGIKITSAECLEAWEAMLPKYSEFKDALQEAFAYHAGDDQEMVFVSATNTIDLRHIASELEKNAILYSTRDGFLTSINGIKLHTTCETQTPKAELIASIIKRAYNPPESALASSMGSVLAAKKEEAMPTIKYVYCLNKLTDEALAVYKAKLDQTNTSIEQKTQGLAVDMVLWMKFKETLTVALQCTTAYKCLLVAKL